MSCTAQLAGILWHLDASLMLWIAYTLAVSVAAVILGVMLWCMPATDEDLYDTSAKGKR